MDKEARAVLRFEKQRILKEREKEWRLRKDELEVRHKNRPKDAQTIAELLDLCFKLKEYGRNIVMCQKALMYPELHSVELFLTLGRSNYNYYMKERSLKHLQASVETYQILFRKKEINQRREPLHYFEFASMLLRNGQHQQALDVLGTASTLYKDKEMANWSYVILHNVAQIMVLREEYTHALNLYQQLMIIPAEVTVRLDQNLEDHIVHLSSRILNIVLSIEMAAVLLKEGKNSKMAFHLLEETWDRMSKYKLSTFMQYNRAKMDFYKMDLMCGCSDFKTWVTSPATFKRLGDIVLGEGNLAIASILYGIAAEQILKRGWRNISDDEQDMGISYLLDRGEILAEVGLWGQSEEVAHRAYRLTDGCNIVAVGRCARCCRSDMPHNESLLKRARQIVQIVIYVQAKMKVRLIRIRKRLKKKVQDAASRITATFRMELVKNRMVAHRLSGLSIKNMGRCLMRLKHVWKSGQKVIADWKELWAISANRIKGSFKAWYSRRVFWKFFKGVQTLKRVFVGQQVRWKVRSAIATVQNFLSSNPNLMERKVFHHTIRKQYGFNINVDVIRRLSAGVLCVSAENDMQTVVGDDFNTEFNYPTDADSSSNMMPLHGRKNRVNFKSNDFVAEQAVPKPTDTPSFVEGAHKPGVSVKDGQSWFQLTEPIPTSVPVVNEKKAMYVKKKGVSPVKQRSGRDNKESPEKKSPDKREQQLKETKQPVDKRRVDNKSIANANTNPAIQILQNNLVNRTRSLSKSMLSGTIKDLNTTALFRSSSSSDVIGAVSKTQSPVVAQNYVNTTVDNNAEVTTAISAKAQTASANLDRKKTIPVVAGKFRRQGNFGLDTYEDYEYQRSKDVVDPEVAQKNRSYVYSTSTNSYYFAERDEYDMFPVKKSSLVEPSEEFFSIFNIINVGRDKFTRWIPFGLTPTKELIRILNCTALCIASASFKMSDALRMSRVLRGGLEGEGPSEKERELQMVEKETEKGSNKSPSKESSKSGGGESKDSKGGKGSKEVQENKEDLSIMSRPPPDDCLWRKVRSLEIYGTSMGQSGVACILNLGVQQLTSLCIASTGMTHWSGQVLGRQCLSQLNGVNMPCFLKKIIIENEHKFGDRGLGYLLKYMQHNSSVETLTVRNCGISGFVMTAIHRFISGSSALKYLNLSDNRLRPKEVDSIIVAVANKGSRGVLKQVILRHQSPAISLDKACQLYQRAVSLGVRLTADIIPPRLEMVQEMLGGVDQDGLWVQNINKVVLEMIEFGEKADTTEMSFLKFVII